MISVLMKIRQLYYLPVKTAVLLRFPSLIAVFTYLCCKRFFSFNNTCGKTHKHPLGRRNKGRYQNASLTAEASVAFPIFFFAVLYLLQMFTVLRAELSVAQEGKRPHFLMWQNGLRKENMQLRKPYWKFLIKK